MRVSAEEPTWRKPGCGTSVAVLGFLVMAAMMLGWWVTP